MNRFIIALVIAITLQSSGFSQITIDLCQQKARKNYPQIQQFGVVEQTQLYSIENANRGYLPQINVSAKATYQSQVTELPMKLPGITAADKDQYQVLVDVNQTIWDGGNISSQKKVIQASTKVEYQKMEVDLYTIQERVNQLYFGILLLDEQLLQNELYLKELNNNLSKITSYATNGIANKTDVSIVSVEIIKSKQRKVELLSTRKAYIAMLSAYFGEILPESVVLEKPLFSLITDEQVDIKRPELLLFDAQMSMYEFQKRSIKNSNNPKFSLFVQTGYGKPGLNMLSNDFSEFYLGGLRLSWNIGGYYSQSNTISKIELQKKSVDIQKETFLFNINQKVTQQKNDIDKLTSLIQGDAEIIQLRSEISNASLVKAANGTISVSDLMRDMNYENLAKQDKILHEIQLLLALYNYKNTLNN